MPVVKAGKFGYFMIEVRAKGNGIFFVIDRCRGRHHRSRLEYLLGDVIEKGCSGALGGTALVVRVVLVIVACSASAAVHDLRLLARWPFGRLNHLFKGVKPFIGDGHTKVFRESKTLLEARILVLSARSSDDFFMKQRAQVDRVRMKVSHDLGFDCRLRGGVCVRARPRFIEVLSTAIAARGFESSSVARAASPMGALLLGLEDRVGSLALDRGQFVRMTSGRALRLALFPMDDDRATNVIELDVIDVLLLIEGLHDVVHRLRELCE